MNRSILLALVLPALCSAPLAAQDDAAAELEAAGRNIMSDPRLRNVLRSVKQDPAAAMDDAKQNPEDAVREAARLFQANANGIDAEELKTVVSQAQSDGTMERVIDSAAETIKREAPAVRRALEEKAPEVAEAVAQPDASDPSTGATTPPGNNPPVTAQPITAQPVEVPATRPAPGISGGAPTPVAMPVEGGEPAPTEPAVVARPMTPPPAVSDTVKEVGAARPIPGTSPTVPELPNLDIAKVPAPVPLAKKYQTGPSGAYPAAGPQRMDIRSKEATMDNTKGILVFTGNVFLDHPEFEIKCDKLEIELAEGVGKEGNAEANPQSDANFKRAIASGGMVEIKRIAPDEKGKMKTQIAIARNADYNAITKDIVLSGGPPYIQDGEAFVKTSSNDAKIIMRGNGLYEIEGTTRNHMSFPVKNEGGKMKGDVGLPSGLNNVLDGRR